MKRSATLILVCALGGCAGHADQPAPPPEPARPVVRGAQNGLEMWWWVVSEDHAPVVPLLLPYADRPVPLPPEDLERLVNAGFRVVSVPIDELESLQSRLPTIGAVQRQWLGQVPSWTDIFSGPPWSDRLTVDVGDGLLALGPGRMRMLLRCWIVPDPGSAESSWPAGAVHIELTPQHLAAARHDRPAQRAGRPAPELEGMALSRFGMSFTMKGGEAVLLVPEAAGAEWTAPSPVPAPEGPPTGPVGPQVAPPPTIGEALLATPKDDRTGARTRAIIVLIARAPERFELTGVTP